MPKEPLEDLPDVLDAGQLAEVLHLSRSGAYNLLNKPDFPTLRVGGKKMVMKHTMMVLTYLESLFLIMRTSASKDTN